MNLFGLALKSYGRHLKDALGIPPAALLGVGSVVVCLCLAATGLAASAVVSMDLSGAEPAQLAMLREDFVRGLVFLSMCGGVFVSATTTAGTAFRIVLRTTGGSLKDRYLLVGATRDLLCLVVPLVLCAVTYVPLATLLHGSIGLVPGLLVGSGLAVLVCVLTASSVELGRTAVMMLRPSLPEAFASAVVCAGVLAAGLALSPLSLLPWGAAVDWTMFTQEGGVDGRHLRGHALFVVVAVASWAACFRLGAVSERVAPVLQAPMSFTVVGLSGRGPLTTLISLFGITPLRVPVTLVLLALSCACAGVSHVVDTELSAALFLMAGAGLAGSIGLRAHGTELPSRWLVLRLAPGSRAVAWTLPVGCLLLSLVGLVPTAVSGFVLFDARAAGYFTIMALTTYGFTLFAGTVVPVSSEEPLSTVTAGAVSFALSGGVVGLIESGLAERSESWAAVTAVVVAVLAIVLAIAVAGRRYEGSVLG